MGRQRSFSEEDVIAVVADMFSAHGFNGTSVKMLADMTGLGKQSLYNSFGDKQGLYLKAVDCAAARFAGVMARMDAASNGRASIDIFFSQLICHCTSPDPADRACIVSSGLLENIDDPVISAFLRQKWQASQAVLRKAVVRGQQDGSIANRGDADGLSLLLMTLMSGLRVTAQAVNDEARLRHAVESTLAVLDIGGNR